MFAREKQARLQWKQMRLILTLPTLQMILCELYTSCVSIVTFAYVNTTILTQLV